MSNYSLHCTVDTPLRVLLQVPLQTPLQYSTNPAQYSAHLHAVVDKVQAAVFDLDAGNDGRMASMKDSGKWALILLHFAVFYV